MSNFNIAGLDNEPDWPRISRAYDNLRLATERLHSDIMGYKKALNDLDGYGTSVANGKDRIFILKEEIARLEQAPDVAPAA